MKTSFEDRLEKRIGRDPGFRVPDDYFENMSERITSALPERNITPERPRLSRWHRLRPYIYLAAMFAGIWCMMKIFHTLSGSPDGRVSIDNPPQQIAQVMEDYSEEYSSVDFTTSVDDMELLYDVSDEYTSFDDFVDDFNYEIDDKYADITSNNLF